MQNININQIAEFVNRRAVKINGIEIMKTNIKNIGFLENNPITVSKTQDGYKLIDGNHRVKACLELGIEYLPAIIKENLTYIQEKQLATQCNLASETIIPTTFVDDAEFIWQELENHTQQEVGEMLGWSRDKIQKYSILKTINKEAWQIIVTTFLKNVTTTTEDVVTQNVTTVTFTEGLLRNILDLTPAQQLELVKDLAEDKINKNKFNLLAKAYKTRNKLIEKLQDALKGIDDKDLIDNAIQEILSGRYDKETGLETLIQSVIDAYEKKNNIRLIHGDFYTEVKNIKDGCIDLIITDPPYNISYENEIVLKDRKNISRDFGEWDKQDNEEFKKNFDIWASEFKRILTENGSGYIFTSDIYISHLRDSLEKAGLRYRATITWHKTNPGTSPTKSNFISSIEYIIYFSKDKPVFNFTQDNDMHNFIESPICSGNERVKDSKGEILHPTQKPQKIIRHLIEISSNVGQTVFDGFMGVGTVGRVAKERQRKFIGIEKELKYFERCKDGSF